LRYEIIFAPEAEEELLALRANERSEVLDAIETHLRFEPEKVSKSRIKRLEGIEWPQYRLRIGDIRVFYDVVDLDEGIVVEVLAIRAKSEAMEWLAQYGRETKRFEFRITG
jgi:mRNA-degrading endonuclease RelE of RelBE toxin-antitoxin system